MGFDVTYLIDGKETSKEDFGMEFALRHAVYGAAISKMSFDNDKNKFVFELIHDEPKEIK